MVPEAPALQSSLDMIPRAGGPETAAVHGSPRARSWRRSGYAANAEGAGERPAAHDGARQRNDELRGRRLRASLVVRLRVVGSRHRQGAHRGGEDQDTEQGRPASLTCPSRIMVPRERPTRPGPGTDELRRRRLLAVPAALVRDVHGLLARDARASRRRHRAVGERLQQLPSPLPRADRRRQAGRGGGGRPAARLSHHLARRGVPVADQHDVQEPHGHRRRGDDPRPAHGCGGARRRLRAAEASGRQAVALAAAKLRPSQIITAKSVENALRVLLAIGGSTNAIIHLTAIAGRVGVPISLERLNEMSDSTPVLVDLKPTGQHYMSDLHAPDLDVKPDDFLVLQNAGPKSGYAMPEAGYLPIPAKLARTGVKDMVRISDARMSGTAYGTIVLHVSPEAAVGGPLALVKTGDRIRLSVAQRSINLIVDEAELSRRRAAWRAPTPPPTRGYAKLYMQSVLQAEHGCDFDFLRKQEPTA